MAQVNPLLAGTAGETPDQGQATPAAPSNPMEAALGQAHGQSSAQFGKLDQSMKIMEGVRKTLDALVKMGDVVETDDVVKAAGDLTSLGVSPQTLAQLLSTMPQGGGQALAAWLQQQDAMVTQGMQQLAMQHQQAAHQMGVDAMHLMMHQHMQQMGQQAMPSASPSATAPGSNQLM